MRFGDIPLDDAVGAILAHSVRDGRLSLKKGRVLSADDVAALKAAGRRAVIAAKLDDGDVHEDAAAERLARAVTGPNLSASPARTGRVNLLAEADGLCVVDRERLDRINRIDESITIATLPQHEPVVPGQMVATVKIIPFAAPEVGLSLSETVAAPDDLGPVIRVAPFRPRLAGLIQTRLSGTKSGVLDKTAQVTAARLDSLGLTVARERRCEHAAKTLAGEIRSMLSLDVELALIVGASAITDRRDVLPEAIELAGGEVEHFGMPVDPGNLLLLGRVGTVPVIGLPGCARSPKLNG
ncbi:MAG: molybdopterin-binding protein, partial [Inquilinus sp.]|nr:molybdopterin-binding protein [Inquilinus sp.]